MFRSMISEDTQVFRFTYFYVGWKPGNSGFWEENMERSLQNIA
jgi:hypothetical protein